MPIIRFLHPPLDSGPSGGNLFDRRIIAMARRNRFPLSAHVVDPNAAGEAEAVIAAVARGGRGREPSVWIWDSLLLRRYAASAGAPAARSHAFLMHYLPSLNPGLDEHERREARRFEDRAAETARFFLATGRGLTARLRERYPAVPSFACEPGVDPVYSRARRTARLAASGGSVQLLSVANLVPAKGYLDLLDGLKGLSQRPWCWHIVGRVDADTAFRREFEALAAPWLARGRIVLHGVLAPRRLARLMSRMDVFVSASHFESYGMALAEAVAAGLPVVATDVGEAHRILGGGLAGVLVPVGSWHGFAAALAKAIDEAGVRPLRLHPDQKPQCRTWAEAFADFSAACRAAAGSMRPARGSTRGLSVGDGPVRRAPFRWPQ